MPNFASTLKQEIIRLARKEVNAQLQILRKASAQYRKQIAALKRESSQLNTHLAQLSRRAGAASPVADDAEDEGKARFSPKSVLSQRKRLGFSAADYGKLVGVTGATIYAWEQAKSRPRATQIQALAQLRGIGKKQAKERLEGAAGSAKGGRSRGRRSN